MKWLSKTEFYQRIFGLQCRMTALGPALPCTMAPAGSLKEKGLLTTWSASSSDAAEQVFECSCQDLQRVDLV